MRIKVHPDRLKRKGDLSAANIHEIDEHAKTVGWAAHALCNFQRRPSTTGRLDSQRIVVWFMMARLTDALIDRNSVRRRFLSTLGTRNYGMCAPYS